MKRVACVFLIGFLAAAAVAVEPPGDSVYHLNARLEDQSGAVGGLDVFAGSPVLVSMFYASCPAVCPLLVSSIQRLERQLEDPSSLRVLLVSLDPENDTPEALAAVAARHRLDLRRWKLARTGDADVRRLAAMLGVRFRELPEGGFNHSTVITLLDGSGRIVAQSEGLGEPGADLVDALRQLATPDPH